MKSYTKPVVDLLLVEDNDILTASPADNIGFDDFPEKDD